MFLFSMIRIQNCATGSIISGRTIKSCLKSVKYCVLMFLGIFDFVCKRCKSSIWNNGAHWSGSQNSIDVGHDSPINLKAMSWNRRVNLR